MNVQKIKGDCDFDIEISKNNLGKLVILFARDFIFESLKNFSADTHM